LQHVLLREKSAQNLGEPQANSNSTKVIIVNDEAKKMNWKAYNELAWIDSVLGGPESFEEETLTYIKAIESCFPIAPRTMLHLGCGAGAHDFHFKKHFSLTGVDISEGMLSIAKKRNPEVTYVQGDMRTVNLEKKFDIVIIPDSIAYMTTIEDLTAAIKTAALHMNPNGVILIVAHLKEEFRNNNFVYTGEKADIHVTVFENNYIISDSMYESSVFYLIRENGQRSVHEEVHTLGLFTKDQWMLVFKECGIKVDEMSLNNLYDAYLLEDGTYLQKIFIGTLSIMVK
jgi:SAM-dependent methyltransferase